MFQFEATCESRKLLLYYIIHVFVFIRKTGVELKEDCCAWGGGEGDAGVEYARSG